MTPMPLAPLFDATGLVPALQQVWCRGANDLADLSPAFAGAPAGSIVLADVEIPPTPDWPARFRAGAAKVQASGYAGPWGYYGFGTPTSGRNEIAAPDAMPDLLANLEALRAAGVGNGAPRFASTTRYVRDAHQSSDAELSAWLGAKPVAVMDTATKGKLTFYADVTQYADWVANVALQVAAILDLGLTPIVPMWPWQDESCPYEQMSQWKPVSAAATLLMIWLVRRLRAIPMLWGMTAADLAPLTGPWRRVRPIDGLPMVQAFKAAATGH